MGVGLGFRGRLVCLELRFVQTQLCCQIVQRTEGGVLARQGTQEKTPAAWMVAAGYHGGQTPQVALNGNMLLPHNYAQGVPGDITLLQRSGVWVVAKLGLNGLQFFPNLSINS